MEARPGWPGGRSWEEGSPSDVAPSPPGAVVPQLGAGVGVGVEDVLEVARELDLEVDPEM